jgi:cyanophycin synthetase
MDENNPVIQEQMQLGKPTAVYENGFITLQKGFLKNRVDTAANIPLTLDGKCTFMIANALAASLAAYVWGFSCGEIWNALRAFTPGFAQTPGRVNVFEFNKFKVIVDYAHNPHGYRAIEEYLQNVDAYRKIGIISGIGDRRDEDIKECAAIAARMFDHIIIRQDHNLRGSSETRINGLIMEGITSTDKNVTYEIIPDEADAIKRAISMASEGDIVVALSELYKNVVHVVEKEQEQERQQLQHAV